MATPPTSTATLLPRGLVAGLAGTVVMTAFQKLIEMPLTGRRDSFAPADLAETVTPVHPRSSTGRKRLNYAAHFALSGLWGTAYAVAAARGLRGQRAVHSVFAVVYAGDLVANTALGLYRPLRWSGGDWVVDVVDKYVQAQATGAVFDQLLDPAG
ncbi:hypothetical protein [Blastococcus sp. SYSU DS0617]